MGQQRSRKYEIDLQLFISNFTKILHNFMTFEVWKMADGTEYYIRIFQQIVGKKFNNFSNTVKISRKFWHRCIYYQKEWQ